LHNHAAIVFNVYDHEFRRVQVALAQSARVGGFG